MNHLRTKKSSGNLLLKPRRAELNVANSMELALPVGRDEMNLIEFPFGPITATTSKTLDIEHLVFDRTLKREVSRRMIITGSDAFGLPKPIDDQVLIGMKALTHATDYRSRRIEFSRYSLCRVMGWVPDGRTYLRLEESFDRIAGTTLKFKDAWWDKGEQEWKSKTFHLIEEVNLCSRDQLDRKRLETGRSAHKLCSFVWGEVVWKSLTDGFIKSIDMELFRRIAQGRRREVPLRLYRILDKRFYHRRFDRRVMARFDLEKLCVGTLGLSPNYSPSQMLRVLQRAADWLIECGYLEKYWHLAPVIGRGMAIVFQKRRAESLGANRQIVRIAPVPSTKELTDEHKEWLMRQNEAELTALETQALRMGFGSDLERRLVGENRAKEFSVIKGGRIRQEYVRRYQESLAKAG